MKSSSTILGTTAMASASALRVAIQAIILPVVGRILGPHAYGEIALVSPFIFFSMLLAESGLGSVIVKTDRLTKELEGTVFCFSGFFSIVFMLLFALFAYPIGYVMHEPMFAPLLMSMSSVLLLASLNVVPAALLLRGKKYNWIAISDVISTIGGVAGVTVGIMLDWGVWSLVAQQISFWFCKVTVVAIGARFRPRFLFRWRLIRENIKFGTNVTGSSIIGFIAANIDNVLIGSIMGSETLGFYALAYQIVRLPQVVLSGSVYFTLFSNTSEAVRDGTLSPKQYLNVLRGILLISAPAMIGMATTASIFIPLLLGDKWAPSVMLIILLTPMGLCGSIGAACAGMLLGLGRSDLILKMGVQLAGLTIIGILIGVWINSTVVAAAVSLTSIFNVIYLLHVTAKSGGTSMRATINATAAPVVSAILMGCIVQAIKLTMPADLMPLIQLVVCIFAGAGAYAALLLGLFHDQLKSDLATVKAALKAQQKKPENA